MDRKCNVTNPHDLRHGVANPSPGLSLETRQRLRAYARAHVGKPAPWTGQREYKASINALSGHPIALAERYQAYVKRIRRRLGYFPANVTLAAAYAALHWPLSKERADRTATRPPPLT